MNTSNTADAAPCGYWVLTIWFWMYTPTVVTAPWLITWTVPYSPIVSTKMKIEPITMPGIVIGSIFIFVLTMGEYGTVQVISQGAVTTVGVYIQNQIQNTQYPQGAASAVLLVFILILGVFAITRFANLREEI